MTEVRQRTAGNILVQEDQATTVRVLQPFDWRPTALTTILYDKAGETVSTAPTGTVGRQVAVTGAAGNGETDPTKIGLTDGGQAESDFRRLDEAMIGLNNYHERDVAERFIVSTYDYQAAATNYLYSMRDLRQAYASGGGYYVWSCFHTVALTATHTATKARNYRLELTWTKHDASTLVTDILIDVVSRPPYRVLSAARAEQMLPGILDVLTEYTDQNGGTIDEQLDLAWERVLREIYGRGFYPDLIRNQEQLESPTAQAIALNMAKSGNPPPEFSADPGAWLSEARLEFDRSVDQMFNNITWYDDNDDMATDSGEESPSKGQAIWVRR